MGGNNTQPPGSNTGVVDTYRIGLTACVDWVQVTFKNVNDPLQIIDLLYLNFNDFECIPYGKYGYKSQYRYNNIAIYFDGTENMGCHLEMTGQGCRQYESFNLLDWQTFFAMILDNMEVNITRLDLAIDDVIPYFTTQMVVNKLKRKHVKSKFRYWNRFEKGVISTGDVISNTIYFGQATSDFMVRIYDKKQERLAKGYDVKVKDWVRTELQLRRKRAYDTAAIIAYSDYRLGEIISGILKEYINFLVPSKDSNKARWKICDWWLNYLGDVAPLKIARKSPDYSIERSANWINFSVTPTLAMLLIAFDYDFDLLKKWILQAENRLDKKHYNAIELFKNNREKLINDLEEYKKYHANKLHDKDNDI